MVKIVNKELKSIKRPSPTKIRKSSRDDYDEEDEIELDSERVILKGKNSGYRRSGPQTEAAKKMKCQECEYEVKDKVSLEKHMQNHRDHAIKCTMQNI